MSGKQLPLVEAYQYLKDRGYSFELSTVRKAAKTGRLKAELVKAPVPYYVVSVADLIEWARDDNKHTRGNKKAKGLRA